MLKVMTSVDINYVEANLIAQKLRKCDIRRFTHKLEVSSETLALYLRKTSIIQIRLERINRDMYSLGAIADETVRTCKYKCRRTASEANL